MLEPDTLSSYQYFDRWRGAGCLEPERRLILAVLEAVDCFQENVLRQGRKQEELFDEAQCWFFDDETEWPFSFLNVCDALGLDANYFRSGLKRWKACRLSEHAKLSANRKLSKSDAKLPRIQKLSLLYVSSK